MFSVRTVNVCMLSIGFMLLFISFQTMSNIMVTILKSVKEDNKGYSADAMIGLAIIYVVLALSNFIAPSVVNMLGARLAMIFGAATYALYIASFFIVQSWVLYVVSFLLGIGAAIIWTAQGTYLTQNSDERTISRNSGIFWATFQCSVLFGNLFVFFVFQSEKTINNDTRQFVFGVLTIVAVLGIVILILLGPAINEHGQEVQNANGGALNAIKNSFALFSDVKILLLCCSFAFTGILLTFAGSIYGPSLGFTNKIFQVPTSLVGLSGVLFGLGEVIGGSMFGILGTKTVIWGRSPIIVIGFVGLMTCFSFIYLNIPDNSIFGPTDDISYFDPPVAWIALVCSFLLGFGDSCFQTQIYSIVGTLYKDDSSPAFAMFKFIQSVATGIGFLYSRCLGVHKQLYILTTFLFLAAFTFISVERIAMKIKKRSIDAEIPSTHQD